MLHVDSIKHKVKNVIKNQIFKFSKPRPNSAFDENATHPITRNLTPKEQTKDHNYYLLLLKEAEARLEKERCKELTILCITNLSSKKEKVIRFLAPYVPKHGVDTPEVFTLLTAHILEKKDHITLALVVTGFLTTNEFDIAKRYLEACTSLNSHEWLRLELKTELCILRQRSYLPNTSELAKLRKLAEAITARDEADEESFVALAHISELFLIKNHDRINEILKLPFFLEQTPSNIEKLLKSKNTKHAEYILSKALRNERSLSALRQAALLARDKGEFQKALSYFTEAKELDTHKARANLEIAQTLHLLERNHETNEFYERTQTVARSNPTFVNVQAWIQASIALNNQAWFQEATNRALSLPLHEKYSARLLMYAGSINTPITEREKQYFLNYLEAYPYSPHLLSIVSAQRDLKNLDLALWIFQQLDKNTTTYPLLRVYSEVSLQHTKSLLSKGKASESSFFQLIEIYQRLLNSPKNKNKAIGDYINILKMLNDFRKEDKFNTTPLKETILDLHLAASRIFPKDFEVQYKYISWLISCAKYTQALTAIKKLIKTSKHSFQLKLLLFQIYHDTAQHRLAFPTLVEAYQERPSHEKTTVALCNYLNNFPCSHLGILLLLRITRPHPKKKPNDLSFRPTLRKLFSQGNFTTMEEFINLTYGTKSRPPWMEELVSEKCRRQNPLPARTTRRLDILCLHINQIGKRHREGDRAKGIFLSHYYVQSHEQGTKLFDQFDWVIFLSSSADKIESLGVAEVETLLNNRRPYSGLLFSSRSIVDVTRPTILPDTAEIAMMKSSDALRFLPGTSLQKGLRACSEYINAQFIPLPSTKRE